MGSMTGEVAAWIRAAAWRDHHRATVAELPTFYARCVCQGGTCGHCTAGRHHACTHERSEPSEHPASYLTNRRGYVVAEVWEIGHRHVWTCSCKTNDHGNTVCQLTLF
jgi:hypothetical protein